MKEGQAAHAAWLEALDEEDAAFLRRFLLASGSLKDLAEEYGVSYPTIRGRLDRLIAKVKAVEDPRLSDPLRRELSVLVQEGEIRAETARRILKAHAQSRKEDAR